MVWHYPVASWLRVACSYVKRCAEGKNWTDSVGEDCQLMLSDLGMRIKREDSVGGSWSVKNTVENVIWCDASSIALGVVLQVGGNVVEDAAWLRKKDDHSHINLAELDAVLKGVNLAVQWELKVLTIMTDSATVHGWLLTTLNNDCKIRVSGMSEALIKRRLGILRELAVNCGMNLSVRLVRSAENKADIMTRVPSKWLKNRKEVACVGLNTDEIRNRHNKHHFGIQKTQYFILAENPETSVDDISNVVQTCEECRSIDPSPIQWSSGSLSVDENWERLAVDVTHYKGDIFLTMVDCGPCRFSIWRKLNHEDARSIAFHLDEVFRERGPVSELLTDNGSAFRSHLVSKVCDKWGIHVIYRCAYRPSGNGIVERNHRTIKSRAARARMSPLDIVFWYNVAPLRGNDPNSAPAEMLSRYHWRFLRSDPKSRPVTQNYQIGQDVFIKPMPMRCHSKWKNGKVTAINSETNVEVDGVPRHIADIRPRLPSNGVLSRPLSDPVNEGGGVFSSESEDGEISKADASPFRTESSEEDSTDCATDSDLERQDRRPRRTRKHPAYFNAFDMR